MVLMMIVLIMMMVMMMVVMMMMVVVMMVVETWPLSLSSLQLPSLRLVIKENVRLCLSFV